MKKILLATAALVVLGAPALAADLGARSYTKAPPAYAAPIYNWTGFYVGGHLGGVFGNDSNFLGAGNSSEGRLMGGLQGGADWQFAPNWVVGIEGQYSWLSGNNTAVAFTGAGAGYVYGNNQRGLASVTGRLGYTWGPGLVYVKGGYAYSDHTDSLTFAGVPVAYTLNGNHRDGYTVGAGFEYMFAPNWSGKAEYQYYDFGKTSFVSPAVLAAYGSSRNDEHSFKVGVNYRFNWAAAGPRY